MADVGSITRSTKLIMYIYRPPNLDHFSFTLSLLI